MRFDFYIQIDIPKAKLATAISCRANVFRSGTACAVRRWDWGGIACTVIWLAPSTAVVRRGTTVSSKEACSVIDGGQYVMEPEEG